MSSYFRWSEVVPSTSNPASLGQQKAITMMQGRILGGFGNRVPPSHRARCHATLTGTSHVHGEVNLTSLYTKQAYVPERLISGAEPALIPGVAKMSERKD